MIIKQTADFALSIVSFETGLDVDITPNVETEIDDVTGNFLLGMKAYKMDENNNNVLATAFVKISD